MLSKNKSLLSFINERVNITGPFNSGDTQSDIAQLPPSRSPNSPVVSRCSMHNEIGGDLAYDENSDENSDEVDAELISNNEPSRPESEELVQIFSRLWDLMNKTLTKPSLTNFEDEEPRDGVIDNELDGPPTDEQPGTFNDDSNDNTEVEPVKRFVKNAHLVYKRATQDGLYEELWIYNVGKKTNVDEYQIRRDILGNTDIEPPETSSPDGTQTYTAWTAGNAQMLHISGLPN